MAKKKKTDDRIVEVLALGQEAKKISIDGTESVGDVLEKAGIDGGNVLADGEAVEMSDSISDTKVLNSVPNVKGGHFVQVFKEVIREFLPRNFSKYPKKVVIEEQAYMKMYNYVKYHHEEIGGLLKIEKKGLLWTVKDAMLLPQRANASYFELDNMALAKFITKIPRNEMHMWKGWWHSHVNMDVFWSSTDIDTFEHLFGIMGDTLGIVLNKNRDIRISILKKNNQYYDAEFTISSPKALHFINEVNRNIIR